LLTVNDRTLLHEASLSLNLLKHDCSEEVGIVALGRLA
jgi:hypothetical protein